MQSCQLAFLLHTLLSVNLWLFDLHWQFNANIASKSIQAMGEIQDNVLKSKETWEWGMDTNVRYSQCFGKHSLNMSSNVVAHQVCEPPAGPCLCWAGCHRGPGLAGGGRGGGGQGAGVPGGGAGQAGGQRAGEAGPGPGGHPPHRIQLQPGVLLAAAGGLALWGGSQVTKYVSYAFISLPCLSVCQTQGWVWPTSPASCRTPGPGWWWWPRRPPPATWRPMPSCPRSSGWGTSWCWGLGARHLAAHHSGTCMKMMELLAQRNFQVIFNLMLHFPYYFVFRHGTWWDNGYTLDKWNNSKIVADNIK